MLRAGRCVLGFRHRKLEGLLGEERSQLESAARVSNKTPATILVFISILPLEAGCRGTAKNK